MARISPTVYYVTAGAVGFMLGSFLVSKVSPFWAWSIAGLVMCSIVLASNEKMRKNLVLGSLAVVVLAAAAGGLASLIYRI